MSQQLTLQGRTLRMLRAGTALTVCERLGDGGHGVVPAVTIGRAHLAVPKRPLAAYGAACSETRATLHVLAVFLLYLYMLDTAVEGATHHDTFSGPDSGHHSKTTLALGHFGAERVFIFEPDDHATPPRPGDPVSVWWRLYPRFFRAVFEGAFSSGLRDPSGLGRVAEGVWRRALVRLGDCVSVCSCQASVFFDPDDRGLRCWN